MARHRMYVEALEASGVEVHVGRFKRKDVVCPSCRRKTLRYEEKETDVSIALRAFEALHLDQCDTLVLVSGDTDLAPVIRTGRRLFPKKRVAVGFPHGRFNAELQQLADFSFRLRPAQYGKHQLPNPVASRAGRKIRKLLRW